MFWMDWPLTALAMLVAPIVAWVLRDYSKRTTKAAHGAMEESSTLTSAIMDARSPQLVRAVKAADLLTNRDAWGANWIAAHRAAQAQAQAAT